MYSVIFKKYLGTVRVSILKKNTRAFLLAD